jgi:hypothetical protein
MLVRKMETHVVSAVAGNIVLESPGPACPMDQMAKVVVLAGAEAGNSARLAVTLPQIRIDPIVQIERRDNDISDTGIADWMSRLARKLKPDLPETRRQA